MENSKNEIWKDVKGYKGLYQVSNLGQVKNIKTNRILKNSKNGSGYFEVKLYGKEKPYIKRIHVIVSESFLNYVPNGTSNIVVDHIDNVKTNNNLSNLRIITHRENIRKSIIKKDTPYIGVYKNGNYSKKWRARFYYKNKAIHVGYFHCDYEAHLAIEKKIKELKENER